MNKIRSIMLGKFFNKTKNTRKKTADHFMIKLKILKIEKPSIIGFKLNDEP